eukprot:6111473-Prymnesium_polylepis.1
MARTCSEPVPRPDRANRCGWRSRMALRPPPSPAILGTGRASHMSNMAGAGATRHIGAAYRGCMRNGVCCAI